MASYNGLTYNFNLIRGSQSPVEIVSLSTTPSIATVNEGDDIRFQAVFRNGSGDYRYSLQQQGTVLAQGQGTAATIDVTAPDNFVATDRTTQSIVYTITVNDGFDTTSTALTLTVSKEDNGAQQLELNVSPTELRITFVADDPDGVGTFRYQWQSRNENDSDWTNVSDSNPYMPPSNSASTIRYRVIVNHTDGQGYRNTYRIGPFPIDVDGDDDGLIDVYYLEDLDAIRNQPDGSGYGLAAIDSKITLGCPDSGCKGYELRRDLDFTTTQSYVDVMSNRDNWMVDDPAVTTDTGWLPIATTATPFTSLFNGNNNNISNLQINRDTVDDAFIGLFAALSSEARLENVGILDVAIEGRGSVGSLVAQNKGTIANSYAQGEVEGSQHHVGGLVAFNDATGVIINSYANVRVMSAAALLSGGLVGNNAGTIRNSYAAGDVGGACDVGGLVAENGSGGEIVNSYAAGMVSRSGSCRDAGTRTRAGGLVADNAGLIRNSYVRGLISAGGGTAGGLVAVGASGTIDLSYWDSTVNNAITNDSRAMTTDELRAPQSARDIYAGWSSDDWDFGTAMQYPLLRYTSPTDIAIAAVCDDDLDTALPPCGSVLLAQAQSGLSNLLFFVGDAAVAPDPPFSLSVLSYAVNVENINTIELLPYGINPLGESIAIGRVGDPTPYFMGKRSGERSLPIPLPEGVSTLEIVVGTDPDDTGSVTYSITVTNTVNRVVVEGILISPDRVSEGDTINLSATVVGGAIAGYMHQWTSDPAAFLAEQNRTAETLSFEVPTNFVSRADAGRDVEITLTVGDGFTSSSATRTVTIAKADNGQPSFTETVTSSSISIAVVPGSDADGDGTIDSYTWQRRSADDTEWTTIDDQTSATFRISPQDNSDTLYRVRVMSTDAQGNGFNSLLGPYRNRTDIDDDDDGLIDIYYLEDLDAVRHQTDGSGYGTTDITRGCRLVGGSETCMGYELRRDLDFASTPSYVNVAMNRAAWTVDNFATAGDSGWEPIGSVANTPNSNCGTSGSDCFAGVFEGNGYRISNLQINRDGTNEIGMFAGNSNTGTIRNLGLRDIEVEGNTRVGGLVGRNEGNLINAHVIESRVEGAANNAGLLVGVSRPSALIINSYVRGTVVGSRWVGGICGLNFGRIINSYAEVMASGEREVSGLAAENQHGTIRNSYAMGSAHITANDSANRRSVGGLLAVLWRASDSSPNPRVTNSYSTVAVTGNLTRNNVGGLIGNTNISDPLITESYWDTDTSGRTASPGGGTPQTMLELQTPTAPGTAPIDVYYQWNSADWDFGTTEQYPALLYNEVDGIDACDADAATPLPRCGSLLPGQRATPVGENTTPTITLTPSVAQTLPLNSTARIVVSIADNGFDGGDSVTLTAESSSRTIVSVTPKQIDNITTDTSITFTLTAEQSGEAVITFTATDSKNISTNTKIVVRTNTPPQVSSVPTSVVATVGEAFRLETGSFFSDADNDALTYSIVVDPDSLSYNFSTTGTLTFTPTNAEASTNTTGFTVTVSAADDTGGTAQAIFALLIDAQPTGSVMISRNSTNQWQLEGDPTGISDDNGIARRTYRWYRNNSIIGGATGNSYTIPGNGRTAGTRYRLDVTIVDNIGQSATVQSDAITIDNIAPIIRGITITVDPPPPPLEEGDEVTITADATDENNDSLTYSWRVTSGHDGINVSSINARQVSFTLPDYLIKSSTLTQQTLALQLVVRDTAAEAVSTMVSVVVNKKDNGQANIGTLRRDNDNERILTLTGLTLTDDPDGGGLSSTVAYQWQRCWGSDGTDCSDANNWVNISGAIGNSYTIPASLSGHTITEGDLFRIGVTYTDMQGYERTVYSDSRGVSRSTEVRIRTRVFLEGPLQ